jgi:hypothetical protein
MRNHGKRHGAHRLDDRARRRPGPEATVSKAVLNAHTLQCAAHHPHGGKHIYALFAIFYNTRVLG